MKSVMTRSLLTKPVLLSAGTFPEIYERVITLFMEIASLYWGDSPSRQLSIYARMLDFFACFTDFHISGGPTASPGVFRSADSLSKKLNHFLEYLQVHYAEELPLEEAAERIGVSKYYFTRIFRRHTGQTFNDYLTSLRVRAAEDLLKKRRGFRFGNLRPLRLYEHVLLQPKLPPAQRVQSHRIPAVLSKTLGLV